MTNLKATSLVVATLLSGATLTLAEVQSPTSETSSPSKNPSLQEPSAPAAKPVPLELPEVVARVNDEDVKREEFERAVHDIEMQTGGAVLHSERDAVYRQVLERLVSYHLLAQESKNRQIVVSPTEVQQRLARIRLQYQTEESFQQALTERKITFDELRNETLVDMQIAKMVEDEVSGLIAVSDKTVEDFYIQNAQEFRKAETVQVSHILIRVDQNADEQTRRQQRTVCEVLLRRLGNGENFATLASQYSHDVSGKNGGNLGFVSKGELVPSIEKVAFALAPGELSEIVESPFGFHIIRGGEKRLARTVPFDEAQPTIRGFLEEQVRQEKTDTFIEQLKVTAKIEILF